MDPAKRLADAHERYAAKRPLSRAADGAARQVMPGGNTRSVLHFDPFPFRVASADGANLTDLDGHRYVDLLGNYTAGLLGHSPTPVRRAVSAALETGFALGATHPVEEQAARLVVDRFPSIDQVRFTNSGTEANLMALALALHHTGRRRIVVFDSAYHGGVLSFDHGSSPMNVPHEFVVVPFNDAAAAREAVGEPGGVAAVLVEPVQGAGGCRPSAPGFLAELRSICDESGALLIFDEVMTSRLSPGGAQQRFGVMPDLTTLGKYLAGGLTFGAFGGRRDVLAAFDPQQGGALSQAGTFNNNILSMTAVVATLGEVLTPGALTTVNERGDRLRESLHQALAASPLDVRGVGSMNAVHGPEPWGELFFHDMLECGWYLARRGFIALSLEITDDHVDSFVSDVHRWAHA